MKKAHPSKPYNPDIANTMFRAGMVEAWGRGTIDILNYCSDYGLVEPEFRFDVTGFSVIFRGKTPVKTSEKIVRIMAANGVVTIAELSEQTGVSTRSVERNIKSLQEKKIIQRQGPAKGGTWIVNKDSK